MLYETLLQSKIFLCALYFGILCGIFLTAKNGADKLFKNKKAIVIVTDILFFVVAAILFLTCINLFNFGEFRLFELLGFALGIVLEQISVNKIVEKAFKMLYTLFAKMFAKLKNTKIFKRVFK